MSKENNNSIKVGFISLGCAKNLVDSQIMAGNLIDNNITLAPTPEDADVIIVNTCSFIHDAREESIDAIISACEMKQKYGVNAVVVAGCLPQRYKDNLADNLPEVDAFIGLDELNDITDIVTRTLYGEKNIRAISEKSHRLYDPGKYDIVFSSGSHAYIKIAEGCNHRCAFCAIPGIRGTHRSRTIPNIVAEAEKLISSGFSELDLISQDTTYYGKDFDEGALLLPRLLSELAKLPGDYWIRFLYGYPSGITDELLHTISEITQVCNYFDIPVQHSHPDILKAMLRADTVEPVIKMAERIRTVIPDATLRTTCLVGFPGETDEHFEHLLNFIKEVEFDHLGVFTFSPEEDTPAFDMENCPPPEVAEQRRDILMSEQQKIVNKKLQQFSGMEAKVLPERRIEEDNKTFIIARNRQQAPDVDGRVIIEDHTGNCKIGEFVNVRYFAAENYDLFADLI